MRVIDTEKLPIKMWLEDIEDGAVQQAKNLANLPFVFKWVAIMMANQKDLVDIVFELSPLAVIKG
jgi:RNA-splicing ligase RtcB